MAYQVTAETITKTLPLPFYADIWFYMMIFALLTAGTYALVMYIINRQRNRLVVRIRNEDLSQDTYVFHKFQGEFFKIKTKDITAEGKPEHFEYKFVKSKMIRGEWGRYIDYKYKVAEPLDPLGNVDDSAEKPDIIRLLVSLTETSIFTNLLLSSKFKDFVIMMLWIVVILSGCGLLAQFVIPQFMTSHTICTLDLSNQTAYVIQNAIKGIR